MFLLPYGLVPLALMDRFIYWFPCLWIAPIFQLSVTVEDVTTAPLQFFSHRGFARARNSLDKIISLTHFLISLVCLLDHCNTVCSTQ